MSKNMNQTVAIVDRYPNGHVLAEDSFNVKIARAAGLEPVLIELHRNERQVAEENTAAVIEAVLATGARYAIVRGFLWLADGQYAGCEVANELQKQLDGVVCTGTSDARRHPLCPQVDWECPPERAAKLLLTGREGMVERQIVEVSWAVQMAEQALEQAQQKLQQARQELVELEALRR